MLCARVAMCSTREREKRERKEEEDEDDDEEEEEIRLFDYISFRTTTADTSIIIINNRDLVTSTHHFPDRNKEKILLTCSIGTSADICFGKKLIREIKTVRQFLNDRNNSVVFYFYSFISNMASK